PDRQRAHGEGAVGRARREDRRGARRAHGPGRQPVQRPGRGAARAGRRRPARRARRRAVPHRRYVARVRPDDRSGRHRGVPPRRGLARVPVRRVARADRGAPRTDPGGRGPVLLQAHPPGRRRRTSHRRVAVTLHGDLVLEGRVLPASNATFVGTIEGVRVVYKPVAGERPLWDFPDAVLAHREVAAHLVSEATGWNIVPPTWLGEGPHGPGMLQRWCDTDPQDVAVTLVPSGSVPTGWCHVLDGLDAEDRPVALVHEDSPALRRMAV